MTTVRTKWSGRVAALAPNALLDAGERLAYWGCVTGANPDDAEYIQANMIR